MYIGKVAQLTGASCKATRHYERIGLIPEPARKGHYRHYSESDAVIIHMIKTAQSVGFSLDDLRELIKKLLRIKLLHWNMPGVYLLIKKVCLKRSWKH